MVIRFLNDRKDGIIDVDVSVPEWLNNYEYIVCEMYRGGHWARALIGDKVFADVCFDSKFEFVSAYTRLYMIGMGLQNYMYCIKRNSELNDALSERGLMWSLE